MLIDLEHIKFGDGHPDTISVLILINELFQSHPELFGSPEQQHAFATDCAAEIAKCKEDPTLPYLTEFSHILPALLKKHKINSLAEIDAVFVAPDQGELDRHAELTSLFRRFHPIQPGQRLYANNAHALATGMKADFVITGNIVNAPGNHHQSDTMRACAMMLKQGGTAIHLLSYGESTLESWSPDYNSPIADPAVHAECGQSHRFNIPPGAYQWNGRTFAMLLRQELEIPYDIAPVATPQPVATEPLLDGTINRTLREKE